jgi:hypothetical protein
MNVNYSWTCLFCGITHTGTQNGITPDKIAAPAVDYYTIVGPGGTVGYVCKTDAAPIIAAFPILAAVS